MSICLELLADGPADFVVSVSHVSPGHQIEQLKAVQLEVVRDRPPLKCTPQYAAEEGRASEAKCGAVVAAMAELGYEPYATNCAVHKFKEAGGCEAEMMFVRPGFDETLTRTFCRSQKPHSCGPGAWSLPSDRKGWSREMHEWAGKTARGWPTPPYEARKGSRIRSSTRPARITSRG